MISLSDLVDALVLALVKVLIEVFKDKPSSLIIMVLIIMVLIISGVFFLIYEGKLNGVIMFGG